MKIIIAGSRCFDNKKMIFDFINKSKFDITELVSGGAKGVDKIGEEWAKDKGIPIKQFIPHYSVDSFPDTNAPLLRNIDMANYAEGLIAIWINKSRGTEHMIKQMRKLKKPVEIMEMYPELTSPECIKKYRV